MRQPPLAGELTVTDWPAGNAAGRALRVAQLREHYGGANLRDIVVPLFDPLLVRMTGRGSCCAASSITQATVSFGSGCRSGGYVRSAPSEIQL